ncbi:MAG: DUF1223 domain-containing protein [Bacteroidia bacterium]|nr:DUF1223 domain-containing protein [Bacteroidia bacterium]
MKKLYLSGLFVLLIQPFLMAQKMADSLPQFFQPSVLIELFSSEGCSSCPVADAFMKEILAISDSSKTAVYVLDYHVDIWNRSGWVDPYSDSTYSLRQQNYVFKKKFAAMYTPMAIINGGNKDYAGSDKGGIGRKVSELLNKPSKHFIRTAVAPATNEDSIVIAYNIWGNIDSCDFHAVLVQREIKNMVTAGENKNKVLEHHNVVKKMISIPLKMNKGYVKMGISRDLNVESYRLIVFMQHRRTWDIMASDQLSFD